MTESELVRIDLPAWVIRALSTIEKSDYQAWCVGGCVRDALIGRATHDYDIATNAPWRDVAHLFRNTGCSVHETGAKHGTVTVVVDGNAIEVTTFRTEKGYSDGRHPDSVSFVGSIEEDLARRDFTMNAIAFHPERGCKDPFGGINDLHARVIRCVGDPATRFHEDALRILRACRFASELGFEIDPATLAAMKGAKMALHKISRERITYELERMLCGSSIHDAILATFDVLCAIMPELTAMKGFAQHTPYHIYDVLEHTAYVIDHSPAHPLSRWAALLHDSGKPGAFFMDGERGHFYGHAKLSVILARSILSRMCVSPAFTEDVLTLVRIHDDVIQPTPRAVKRALAKLGGRVDLFEALCDLKRADALSQAPQCAARISLAEDLKATLQQILKDHEPFSLRDLAIDGNDIMALGVKQGPSIGALLNEALDAVIDEEIENNESALIDFIQGKLG